MPKPSPAPDKLLKVGDQAVTPLGIGSVIFVYPVGPHHKITYAVSIKGYRVNRIFDESQVQPFEQQPDNAGKAVRGAAAHQHRIGL